MTDPSRTLSSQFFLLRCGPSAFPTDIYVICDCIINCDRSQLFRDQKDQFSPMLPA